MDSRNVDILLIRMDKLGDLVVSLPVDEHPALAGARLHWFISKGLSFITEQAVPKRQSTEFKRGFSPFEFLRMVRWIQKHSPQTAVLLHNPWWVSAAVWFAGVPERIGRKSQWHSYLFLNVGIRQKRSLADRHESDFNFDIVEWGFNRLGVRSTFNLSGLKRTFLRLMAPNPFGTAEARGLKERGYYIVHPGMAGSALNWPAENFVTLIERLAERRPVLITGTKMDQKYLRAIEKVKGLPNVRWVVDELRASELLDLLSQARAVIAPSTGVLHLSASLGTPTLGIYSPRKVEHPRRWGPKGLYAEYLVPQVADADNFAADVMREITPEHVLQKLNDLENPRGSEAHPSV
ncbi:MAG: glycosyltransferase family 9 protein [Bdellovibrionales bacterium]|nr:glycosyltransferase family 9 protein [Bdellovibrionales bacterium]